MKKKTKKKIKTKMKKKMFDNDKEREITSSVSVTSAPLSKSSLS